MKKKLANKILAGVLASAMIFSMAACGNDDGKKPSGSGSAQPSGSGSGTTATPAPAANTPAPTPKPAPLKITVALPSDEEHLEADEYYDRLVKEINEYTNMDITWTFVSSAAYYDQLNEKIKAGNVEDVIVGPNAIDDQTVLGAAKQGLFWDLAPYLNLDEYENIKAIPEATKRAISVNGAVYYLPRFRTLARNGFGYRKDWLEKLGLKEPTDWDSFKAMLDAFTNRDPDGNGIKDTQGLVVDSWSGVWDIIFMWWGVPDGWGLDSKGDLIHYSQTAEYKEALKAVRELYELGYINDGSVEGIPQFEELGPGAVRKEYFATQKAGCMIQVLDEIRKAEGTFESADVGIATEDNPVVELGNIIDCGKGSHVKAFQGGFNGTIMISKTNIKTEDQLKQVLNFINRLNDGKMWTLIDHGWEGVTWELDENGYLSLYEKDKLAEMGVSTKFRNGFNQVLVYYNDGEKNPRTAVVAPPTSAIRIQEDALYASGQAYVVPNYGSGYVAKTQEDSGQELSDIITKAQVDFITGRIDENGLNEAIARWASAGGTQLTAEMNELYHAAGN